MILDYRKIEIACSRKCFTIKELLKEAKISSFTITRIKRGKLLQCKTAGKLAAALGVDVAELLAEQ